VHECQQVFKLFKTIYGVDIHLDCYQSDFQNSIRMLR
jgi:hypothetical protein